MVDTLLVNQLTKGGQVAMENERNNILGYFRYGFCDLLGEFTNLNELESQLGWDEEAVSLLTEIYPIIGKMNLDLAKDRKSIITFDMQYKELPNYLENSKWREKYGERVNYSRNDNMLWDAHPMEVLTALSDYNDIVVGLRHLLYSEIELCNYKILDEEYDEEAGNILFELGLQLINFFEESFGEINFDGYRRFKNDTNSRRVIELVDFIEKRIIKTSFFRSSDSLVHIIECLEAIKNSRLVTYADRLWDIFLLKLYSVALFGDELSEFQGINIRSNNGRYESIVQNSYRKIDNSLLMLQRSNVQNMLSLYSMEHLSSRVFYNRDIIRQLFNVLNSCGELGERYLITIKNNGGNPQNSSGKNPSPKCFAAMYNRDTRKKYAAISGVFDADMYLYPGVTTKKEINKSKERKKKYNDLVLLLKNILGNSYEVIDSDDEVKYYHKKGGKVRSVTAQRYINYPHPVDKRPGNRMFSCCERKLSTKLELGCEHDLYVKYAPCTMCERMIAEETKNNTHFIHVFCAGKIKDIEKDKLKKYDKSAEAVN